MNKNILNLKTTISPLRDLINRSPWRSRLFLIPLTLALFALAPASRAVSPAPDGGYPNGNTAEGAAALQSLTTGAKNTALGNGALFSNTIGFQNTATGAGALFKNTANDNTATGAGALFNNTLGTENTAIGLGALFSNTTIGANSGHDNTATGSQALASNTIGSFNTATGAGALVTNIDGISNSAVGYQALFHNTHGFENTASGDGALFSNTAGDSNTAVGYQALLINSIGFANTAIGDGALFINTGSDNIALGVGAGDSLTTGSHNIDIGASGTAAESGTIRIGNNQQTTRAFIIGISGVAVTGTAVVVNASGQLGVAASSARYKNQIKPMDKASDTILALKPVTFRYEKEIDPVGTPQFGLVAEEVEKVNPDLVVRDKEGKPYTVRYDAVNAMLLNEFLKEHRKVEKLESTVLQQQKQIEALTTGLQKVSNQLEVSKPATAVVVNE
jgi:hypothetical protein